MAQMFGIEAGIAASMFLGAVGVDSSCHRSPIRGALKILGPQQKRGTEQPSISRAERVSSGRHSRNAPQER